MKKHLLLLFTFYLLLFSAVKGQTVDKEELFVESWKKGNEQITIQNLNIKLTDRVSEFKKEIMAVSGKKYVISIVKNPAVDIKGEHWKIMLNEIKVNEKYKEDYCGDLLLVQKPCETGGDYFPRENYASYFYPNEEKRITINGKTPMLEWKPLYPIKTVRNISVDGFYVIIKSGNIVFDEVSKSKIKSFEIDIELRNNLEF